MLKQQKGITLLGLVFTIIAMLALAAIAIAMVLDELTYNPEPVQVYNEQQVINTDNANNETETPEAEIQDENTAQTQENVE